MFMSWTLHEVYVILEIKLICTSVYQPQTDGLVEHFNQTLQNMICKFIQGCPEFKEMFPYE